MVRPLPSGSPRHISHVIIASVLILFVAAQLQLKETLSILNHQFINHQNDAGAETEVNKIGDLQLSPIQVAFGLCGNHPGFLSEFEVALKSVLLNAPLERNISIHILADQEAFDAMKGIFNRTELSTWQTRNPTEIHVHDVTADVPQMESEVADVFRAHNPNVGWSALHTMGTYYRLFVERYVSNTSAKHILYMDTDVVIMANLEALWEHVESEQQNALFHWGKNMVAGFVVMNLERMNKILPLAKNSSLVEVVGTEEIPFDDQYIYRAVNISHPNEVNVLPPGWDMTVTAIWQSNNHPYDKKFPNVGMLHFNGGGLSQEAYFNLEDPEQSFSTKSKLRETWGNGKFYATLPWEWARYQAKSLARPGSEGHPIRFFFSKGMLGGQNISESESTK